MLVPDHFMAIQLLGTHVGEDAFELNPCVTVVPVQLAVWYASTLLVHAEPTELQLQEEHERVSAKAS
ncbi:MAG: hypothetical protein KC776_17165 [Myxococcales bacterium]|nr:hypothetical protein [Myxococcales bacterium]